jgi:hypothetical protein
VRRRACSSAYWHFPSEADLRSAVLDTEYADMVASIEHALSQAPPGADPLTVALAGFPASGRDGALAAAKPRERDG